MKPTQQAIEAAARAVWPDLFSDDDHRRHRASSPLTVDAAREVAFNQMKRALSADLGDMVLMPLPARPETEVKG